MVDILMQLQLPLKFQPKTTTLNFSMQYENVLTNCERCSNLLQGFFIKLAEIFLNLK